MKMALVGDPWPAKAGDYDIANLADALVQRGHDVRLYTAGRVEGSSVPGYRVVQIPVAPADGHLMPVIGDLGHFLHVDWGESPPNAVHCFGWAYGLAAQLAAKRRPLPVVQALHRLADPGRRRGEQTSTRGTAAAKLEALLARSATMVTASCTDEIDDVIRMGCGRASVAVLPSGVDVDAFHAAGTAGSIVPPRTSRHRIVALAQDFSEASGFDRVVAALPALPTAEVILLADGDDHPHEVRGLVTTAARLGVADRTHVVATTKAGDIAAWLRSADVAVCPAPYDPDTRTVLQAMCSGIPVVAADSGGPRDAVVAEVTGLLVPAGDKVELSRALHAIVRQNVLREGMGMAGRTRARSRYSWERIATDVEVVYRAAVQRHRRVSATSV